MEPEKLKRRKKMSILEDGVFSSVSYHGHGIFRFDRICDEHKTLLKSIKPRQRKKFRKNGLVPRQLLQVLWELDFLPGEKSPQEGMRIPALLEFLRELGLYRNETNRLRGALLHDRIDEEECPYHRPTDEMFIRVGRNKFMPISALRKQPGTIFR
jgi:hypothetical protein